MSRSESNDYSRMFLVRILGVVTLSTVPGQGCEKSLKG